MFLEPGESLDDAAKSGKFPGGTRALAGEPYTSLLVEHEQEGRTRVTEAPKFCQCRGWCLAQRYVRGEGGQETTDDQRVAGGANEPDDGELDPVAYAGAVQEVHDAQVAGAIGCLQQDGGEYRPAE